LVRFKRGLEAALDILGRVDDCGDHFHSLEDRRGSRNSERKNRGDYVFRGGVDLPELRSPRAPELKWVSRKAIVPGAASWMKIPAAAARSCGFWRKFEMAKMQKEQAAIIRFGRR